MVAEMTMIQGLEIAWNGNKMDVILVLDNLNIVNALNGHGVVESMGSVVSKDLELWISKFSSSKVVFNRRIANGVAHALAKWGESLYESIGE
ncbi:hypothetical protein M5689_019319 [Euphorbia peplus]|nr:hypothetical protein M5689_019319 [Euphorbia peplus]